jgi:histidinol-phosphate phosphatase family protein
MRTAVVLAGGLGTRLRSATDVPKVAAPVAGRPFLSWLLDPLAAQGFGAATIATGHAAGIVETAIGSRHGGMAIAYSREPSALGTGGALKLAGTGGFVLNGDSYCGLSFDAFESFAKSSAAIALTRVPDTSRYGRVDVDDEGRVTAFREKGVPGPGWINAGIYFLPDSIVAALPPGPSSLERDLFPRLAANGSLRGYRGGGPFLDIGIPETYAAAPAFFADLTRTREARGLALLDRDGTIIEEKHYLHDPDQVVLIPGAADAIRVLRRQGLVPVVLTNQSGVSRDLFSLADVDAVHARVNQLLGDAAIERIFVCPHHPDDRCACRKPRDGLVREAEAALGLPALVAIGDKTSDVELPRDLFRVLVRTGWGRDHLAARVDFVADDLWAAAVAVESHDERTRADP